VIQVVLQDAGSGGFAQVDDFNIVRLASYTPSTEENFAVPTEAAFDPDPYTVSYILSDNASGWDIHPLVGGVSPTTHQPSAAIAASSDTTVGPNGTSTKITYSFNTGSNRTRRSFAEIRKPVLHVPLSNGESVSLWIQANGTGHKGTLRLYFTDGTWADADLPLTGTAAQTITIPLSDFMHTPTELPVSEIIGLQTYAVALIFTGGTTAPNTAVNNAVIHVENILLNPPNLGTPATNISLQTRVTVKLGHTTDLTSSLVVTPSNYTGPLVWTSSNDAIASVTDGVVQALLVGTVLIKCQDSLSSTYANCLLTVIP
jgi:hypothetical protein